MRLHILGDLHLEFGEAEFPAPEADVVVLSGDIHLGRDGLKWIRRQFPHRPVVYVLGNHEFYRQAIPSLTVALKQESDGEGIHVLENSSVSIDGVTFLGCTLWTDFMAATDPKAVMRVAERAMSDYSLIRNSSSDRPLRASDTNAMHHKSVEWLRLELGRANPARTVVVTHHAPSHRSQFPAFADSPIKWAMCSSLDSWIGPSGVPLWIHGHTHYNVDYMIGATRVLSNQRGYPEKLCRRFDPALTVEV